MAFFYIVDNFSIIMLEGKALVIAVMMLTAAPIAATDPGQAFITDITDNVSERFESTNPDREEILPDKDTLLEEENDDVPCYTPEEWKVLITERENYVEEERKEDDRARGTDDKKDDYDEKDYLEKKEVVTDKEDCLTAEQWNAKFESDEKEPCFTLADLEKKMKDDRKDWNKDGKDWEKDESGEDRNDEDGDDHSHVDDEADDHSHDDDKADDHNHVSDRYEENWEEFRAVMVELKEACEEGDEEACLELREMIAEMAEDRAEKDWNHDWGKEHTDWNKERGADEACLTMEQWKEKFGKDKKDKDEKWAYSGWSHDDLRTLFIVLEKDCEAGSDIACEQFAILEENKEKFGKDKDYDRVWNEDDFEKSDEEWEEIRTLMAELGEDCEAGNEEACEELEEWTGALEEDARERKEECSRDDKEESDEEDDSSEDNSDEEDDSNEDESDEE